MREKNKNKSQLISTLIGAFFVFSLQGFSQTDSLYATPVLSDTTYSSFDTSSTIVYLQNKPKHKKSPRVALISSAIIPGLGQAYNGKYWKIPIIYGGGAAIYYMYDYNNDWYQRCKTAINQINNKVDITDPDLIGNDLANLQLNRDNFRRSRDYTVIFMGLLYAANIVDAMVDAYMFDYDVSRDLSLHVDPTLIPSDPYSYIPTCGLKLSLRF